MFLLSVLAMAKSCWNRPDLLNDPNITRFKSDVKETRLVSGGQRDGYNYSSVPR